MLPHEWDVLLLRLDKSLEISVNLPALGLVESNSLISVVFHLLHASPSIISVDFDLLNLVRARGFLLYLWSPD